MAAVILVMQDGELAAVDRRPIQARNTRWAAAFAMKLALAGVRPNWISWASVVCAVFAGAALVGARLTPQPVVDAALYVLAILGIQGRLLCNLFDGMVAVE